MRALITVVGLLACFAGFGICERAGRARVLINQRKDAALLPATNKAVRLSHSDPETHYARAMVLWRMQRFPEAIKEYEIVVRLRPGDYVPWLDLGSARDRNGDLGGALMAFKEGVRLAPYYGEPRWELGRLLLKAGRRDDAFVELRQAAMNDPRRVPDIIDLAWQTSGGDARAVQQAVVPGTAHARLTLARFLVEHGKTTEAIELFRGTSDSSSEDRRPLLTALLTARKFTEAYEVWSSGQPERQNGFGSVDNGGFEEPITLKDPGFGWQLADDQQTVRVALDISEPHTGRHSLRIDWNGLSDTQTTTVSQLVLVEPNSRYRLSFAARCQELLTVALPVVTIIDAGDDKKTVMLQSRAIPKGTSGWQQYSGEFTTAETTRAVLVRIHRENCSTPPCPAFGHAWFDDFSLTKLSQ